MAMDRVVEMEKCQRSPGDIQKYGAVTEEQEMESRAQVRGLPALVSTSGGEKRGRDGGGGGGGCGCDIHKWLK
jgi:hypothetical protein